MSDLLRLGRQELLDRIAELETRVAQQDNKLEASREAYEEQRDLNAILRRDLNAIAHAGVEDVWRWQGDDDDPESLACPVVMSADTLREMVAENARLAEAHGIMLETLTHAQARGTALLDEARALRRVLSRRVPAEHGMPDQPSEQLGVLVDLLTVRWRGDAKYGTAEAHADRVFRFRNDVENDLSTKWAREKLAVLRAKKGGPSGYADWRSIVLEEVLELLSEDGVDEDRVEAEALDVANVALKMVESIRIHRARGAT